METGIRLDFAVPGLETAGLGHLELPRLELWLLLHVFVDGRPSSFLAWPFSKTVMLESRETPRLVVSDLAVLGLESVGAGDFELLLLLESMIPPSS